MRKSLLLFWLLIMVLGGAAIVIGLCFQRESDPEDSVSGLKDYQKETEVFYLPYSSNLDPIKLSKKMSEKVIEIVSRKPTTGKIVFFDGSYGTFIVGKRSYDWDGGYLSLNIDTIDRKWYRESIWGFRWGDRALQEFQTECMRVRENKDLLATFEPSE